MKKVAETIKKLSSSEVFARIMDPSDRLEDVVSDLKAHWAYDLYSRRPGPALLEDGVLTPTDLDLACFLSALADRGAVINLPKYELRRAATVREGEHVVSKDNRHGHVVGLVSNAEVFSFSVRVLDANVITHGSGGDGVGAFRNFMVVDLNGDWYDGWKSIEFFPSVNENSFLEDKSLWTGNKVYFDNFVHPNRWISFYGQWYLLTKILVARLRAEASFRRAEVVTKLASGLTFPSEKEYQKSKTVGESKTELVAAFAAEVDGADVPEVYTPYPNTVNGLVAARERAVRLTTTDVPALNFACRATELAFARKAGLVAHRGDWVDSLSKSPSLVEPFPAWISGAKWDHSHKIKRTVWNRLVLHQSVPFTEGLALRYRVYAKSERVAA